MEAARRSSLNKNGRVNGSSCTAHYMQMLEDFDDLRQIQGDVLEYEVLLHDHQPAGSYEQGVWEMDLGHRWQAILDLKKASADNFRSRQWGEARVQYSKALDAVQNLKCNLTILDMEEIRKNSDSVSIDEDLARLCRESHLTQEQLWGLPSTATIMDVEKTLKLNLAAVLLEQKQYEAVIEVCSEVLKADPLVSKGLYRRGIAYTRKQDADWDRALQDFRQCRHTIEGDIALRSDSKTLNAIANEIQNIEEKMNQHERKESSIWKDLFK